MSLLDVPCRTPSAGWPTPTSGRIAPHSRRALTASTFIKLNNSLRIISTLCGLVAQSVEQRTENPCVGGSIPPRATKLK